MSGTGTGPRQYATVMPSGPQGDPFQRVNVNPRPVDASAIGQGMQDIGTGLRRAGEYFGMVAADDAATQYQERVNEIMHGKPGTTGPDGKPDLGYMGLKGRAALDARPDVDRRMEELRKEVLSGLKTLQQQHQFNNFSRRYKTWAEGRMGQHADTQANVWYDQVDKASAANWQRHISTNAEDPGQVLQGREELRRVYVQKAERAGGGPEMVQSAINQADREAVIAQASAISVRDPARAMRIIENNKSTLGVYFDEMAGRFRARAEQQEGREVADWMLTGAPPPKGDDPHAVVRHFEGFREKAYWDVNHWRVGYGSDTITRPDGTVVPVTADTTTTRADAERDLDRRVKNTQGQVRQAIGNSAWEKLSPQAQASLTSVVYNYGRVPDEITAAARQGGDLSAAVRSLARHNAGVNAGRRASEAANMGQGVVAEPRTQAEIVEEIKARNMPPQAEAAAIARVNASYRLQNAVETKRRAEFKQKTQDSVAEALNTGTTTNPVAKEEFIRHYGPADGEAKYADYESDILYSADRHALESMSDVEQQQFLDRRLPKPGERGYAHAMTRHTQLQKAVADMQEIRRNDPAAVVSKSPAVVEAMSRVNQRDPSTFKQLASARLAEQERLGIPPEFQSPITKAEALRQTTPLRRIIAGDTQGSLEAIREVGRKFQQMFGEYADEAFTYAMRAQKIDAEMAQQAGVVLRKLRANTLIPSDVRGFDISEELAAEMSAVRTGGDRDLGGYDSAPEMARGVLDTLPMATRGQVAPTTLQTGFEGTPVIKGQFIPPAAIDYLLNNPATQEQFDAKYGTGRAKDILDRYKVAPGLP